MTGNDARSRRSAAKREAILSAALELFTTRGFTRTTIKDLAEESGVSTATIYAHFEDKENLLDVLVDTRMGLLLSRLDDVTATESDPLDRLMATIRVLGTGLAEDPLLSRMLVSRRPLTERDIATRARALEDGIRHAGVRSIEAAVSAGRLHCDDPEALAALCGAVVRGWILNESLRSSPVSIDRVMDMLTELIRGSGSKQGRHSARG